mgnify:FL=1
MEEQNQILKPLKGFNSFQEVMKNGKRFRSKNLLASVQFCSDNENEIYFGVSIGKKKARKAVVRNRVKRLLRESLRKKAKENAFPKRLKKIILIRLSAPEKPGLINLKDINPEIEILVNNINAYVNKLNNETPSSNTDQIL